MIEPCYVDSSHHLIVIRREWTMKIVIRTGQELSSFVVRKGN